jgi:hypothetical protein
MWDKGRAKPGASGRSAAIRRRRTPPDQAAVHNIWRQLK